MCDILPVLVFISIADDPFCPVIILLIVCISGGLILKAAAHQAAVVAVEHIPLMGHVDVKKAVWTS